MAIDLTPAGLRFPDQNEKLKDTHAHIEHLARDVDTRWPRGWATLPLSTGFSAQAGFMIPRYRIIGSVAQEREIELRGTARFNTAGTLPGIVNMIPFTAGLVPPDGAQIQGGGAADGGVVIVPVVLGATSATLTAQIGFLNFRSDGIARVQNPAGGTTWNLVHLHGVKLPLK